MALGACLSAACTTGVVQHASVQPNSSSAVPWLPLPPTGLLPQPTESSPNPPVPIPAGTPACTASQLEAILMGSFGATGHMNTPVFFRNRSTMVCYLEGYPDLTILSSAGNVLAHAVGSGQRSTFFSDGPEVPVLMEIGTPILQATEGLTQPQVRGQAYVNIEWYDCRSPVAASLAVDLPAGGGRLMVPYAIRAPNSPTCDSPGIAPAAALSRTALFPSGYVWPPEPTYITVAVSIAAPASVKRGSMLVYLVTVRNTSEIDYQLAPCPDYVEFMLAKIPVGQFQLNCGPVGHIAPNAEVTFEMRLALPPGIALGANNLTWTLLDNRLAKPTTQTTIDIA